ncbi:MAG: YidC/Oxa1 family membrane protein insertase [Actinomycetota bacterium]|nr:YidC/Oxa1 family membrane protein insertase [Actinomycetota bacterium]
MERIFELLMPIQNVMEHIMVYLYQNVVQSYGWVIVLLTVIVRIVLTPLTISQTKSMAKMQKMQPKIQEIQKKFKGDQQKIQEKTMEFYKENNVNPLAGCLPLILQMPIFFALFQTLRNPTERVTSIIESFQFGWLNLKEPDPYYILVILMVGTMFLTTKMTTTDPKQSFLTYVMPLVFGFISFRLPSGILVYWVTTNVWTMGQQYLVNRWVRRGDHQEKVQEKAPPEEEKPISEEEKKEIAGKKRKKRRKKK